MGWLSSLAIAFLTGILSLFASGVVAALCVEWYRISSFEGGSGFFVVFLALFGGMAGTVIGLIAARVVAARPQPSFIKGLGASAGVVLALLLVIAGVARVLADVPPEIDGDTLLLLIELKSPAGDTTDLAALKGQPYVRLAVTAPFSNVERASSEGPLWLEDLRREDGRWIVPGVVPIFTARGKKVVDVGVGDKTLLGLLTPLAGSPSRRDMEWSDWFPHAREGDPPLPDQFTLRYRVVRTSDSARTLTSGPFEIDHKIASFYHVSAAEGFAADTTFSVRYRGQPVPELERLDGVAVVNGPAPALAVRLEDRGNADPCRLAVERDGQIVVTPMSSCGSITDAPPLTNDAARYAAARKLQRLPGWLDRQTFNAPGLYLYPNAILDSRTLTVRRVKVEGPSNETPNTNVPPLGISPDERSIAWWANASDDDPKIGVTDTANGRHALLPVDRARMRYATFDQLDPGWLMHHFQWTRGSDGADLLEPRDFVPLPYRGEFSNSNDYPQYKLEPAGAALRKAMEEWLVAELKASERPGNQPNDFSHTFSVDGVDIDVMYSDGSDYVAISFPIGKDGGDPKVIEGIGKRFDEELKTGKYDALFGLKKH